MDSKSDLEVLAIVSEFDTSVGSFKALDISDKFDGLFARRCKAGDIITTVLRAEKIAWEIVPDYQHSTSGWKTYYGPVAEWGNGLTSPSIDDITREIIEYWIERCKATTHLLMKIRYADVAWDFGIKINHSKVLGGVPQLMINSVLQAARLDQFPYELEGYRNLHRALVLAAKIRDANLISQVQAVLISYEDQHAVDEMLGTWGCSFDLLIESKNRTLMSNQLTHIIEEMEKRLERLSIVDTLEKLDPHRVEAAALRLANYYRRIGQQENLLRVMDVYSNAFLRKAQTNVWSGSSWLEGVYRNLKSYGLHDEAKSFEVHCRNSAKKMMELMPSHKISIPINAEDDGRFIQFMTRGSWNAIFSNFCDVFLPIRSKEIETLENCNKDRLLIDLFTPTLVDDSGRTLACLGTFSQDQEGHLVHHYANMAQWNSYLLRDVVEALVERQLTVEVIMERVGSSPLFEASRHPILKRALQAYLEQDWLVAIHLLVPQIEAAIRLLIDLSRGSITRTGKHGGLQLRTLDDLLGDEVVQNYFGNDVTFYFRSLLTDQRGLNIRNDVSHGITPTGSFNSMLADRLFHILMLIGAVRCKQHETEVDSELPKDKS